MFVRKKDYYAMVQKYNKMIDDHVWEMARYKADASCARRGIEHALIYLKRAKDDENVAIAIERLKSCYIVSGGDRECLDMILNND